MKSLYCILAAALLLSCGKASAQNLKWEFVVSAQGYSCQATLVPDGLGGCLVNARFFTNHPALTIGVGFTRLYWLDRNGQVVHTSDFPDIFTADNFPLLTGPQVLRMTRTSLDVIGLVWNTTSESPPFTNVLYRFQKLGTNIRATTNVFARDEGVAINFQAPVDKTGFFTTVIRSDQTAVRIRRYAY